jgi:hypothetical protein
VGFFQASLACLVLCDDTKERNESPKASQEVGGYTCLPCSLSWLQSLDTFQMLLGSLSKIIKAFIAEVSSKLIFVGHP